MSAVVKGTELLVVGPMSSTWDVKNGGTTTKLFSCTDLDAIIAQANAMIDDGWSTSIEQTGKGPLWTLKCTYNDDIITDPNARRIPEVVWEVEPIVNQQNVFDCNDRALVSNLSADTRLRIEKKLKEPKSDISLVNTGSLSQYQNASIVYNLQLNGVHRYFPSVSVKRSIIVNPRYQNAWSIVRNGMVLTKQVVVMDYYVPFWVASLMPQSDYALTTDSVTGIVSFKGYFEYAPRYESVSRNKVKISQNWVYNKWPVGPLGLYDVVGL